MLYKNYDSKIDNFQNIVPTQKPYEISNNTPPIMTNNNSNIINLILSYFTSNSIKSYSDYLNNLEYAENKNTNLVLYKTYQKFKEKDKNITHNDIITEM